MPLGFITDETQVNTTATGNQRAPATAALTNGGYVTVWASDTGDGSGKAIMGQLFAADGSKVGAEFLVNTTTAGDQDLPDVVSMPAGQIGPTAFFVVWQSAEAGGSVIRARRFLEDGTPVRFVHLDSADTPATDRIISGDFGGSKPAAGLYGSGRVAFVWEAPSGDGDGTAIVMAQYAVQSGGGFISVVNTTTAGNQVDPRVGPRSLGELSVVWESQEPSGDVIRSRIVRQAGSTGGDVVISDGVGEDESLPNFMHGGALALWNSGTSIKARLIFSTGPTDPSFVLNTTPGGVIGRSDFAAVGNGNDGKYMAVYFTRSGDDGSSYSIRAELFDLTLGSESAEFLVPQRFAGAQEAPTILRLAGGAAGGHIVITWASEADELGNFEIKQRLLSLSAPVGIPADVTINGTEGDDVLNGTAGDDVMNGLGGNDTINGLGGNDLINGGTGDDVMDGGDGTDTVTYATATGPVTISLANPDPQSNGDAGTDTLIGFENVTGSPFADILIGTDGPNVIDGGAGADTMTGGDGSDIYFVDTAGDTIVELADEGVDEVRTPLASYTLAATLENLTATNADAHDFRGNSAGNAITGGDGDDFFRLQDGGNDTVLGQSGNDSFYFGGAYTADDVVSGGTGRDQVALQGNYALTLGSMSGIEDLVILSGTDTRFGDPGTGLYNYAITSMDGNVAAGATLLVDGSQLVAGESFTFDGSAETNGKFILSGGGGVDTLTGGAGADGFYSRSGTFWGPSDKVTGGASDQIGFRGDFTGANKVVMGADQIVGVVTLVLMSGTDTRFGAALPPTKFDIAMHDGNVASGQRFTIDGFFLGSDETMRIDGSAEQDGFFRMVGGAGADILIGGAGNDSLRGNVGGDTLTGNGGSDTFRYDSTAESTATSFDRILDFTPGTDKLDLSRIDADTFAAGDQAFRWIGSNAFTGSGAASAGELRAYQDGGAWIVQADTDGNGTADLMIELTLQGATPLGQSDFLL